MTFSYSQAPDSFRLLEVTAADGVKMTLNYNNPVYPRAITDVFVAGRDAHLEYDASGRLEQTAQFALAILASQPRAALDREFGGHEIALPLMRRGGESGSGTPATQRNEDGVFQFASEVGCRVRAVGRGETCIHRIEIGRAHV